MGTFFFIQKTADPAGTLPQNSLWCKTDPVCVSMMAGDDPQVLGAFQNPACVDLDSGSAPALTVLFQSAYEYWKVGGAYQHPTLRPPEPMLPFYCAAYKHL